MLFYGACFSILGSLSLLMLVFFLLICPLHSPRFEVDEDCIAIGSAVAMGLLGGINDEEDNGQS